MNAFNVFLPVILLGILDFLWPVLVLRKFAARQEEDLAVITPKYEGINRTLNAVVLLASVLSAGFFVLVVYLFTYTNGHVFAHWIGHAVILWGITMPGLPPAIMAAARGVYPLWNLFGSRTLFASGDEEGIRRFGILQLGITLALDVIALTMLFGAMTEW